MPLQERPRSPGSFLSRPLGPRAPSSPAFPDGGTGSSSAPCILVCHPHEGRHSDGLLARWPRPAPVHDSHGLVFPAPPRPAMDVACSDLTLRATAHQGLTCVLCPHCGVPVSARRGVRLWKELNPRLHLLFCVSSSSTEEALGRPPVTSSSQPQWTLCRTNKNLETYRLSSQQFHEAAAKVEGAIKPRRVEPVCSGLQAQILRCYRDHLQEVLLCADLVRAYQHCVSSAHKARAAPPGLQG
ncbi:MICOS complex subunit MIC25 isoform X9 [Cervus canadensis]|uniref:MICOS complex subunit MIC25 isoform X9 n=1 Tax=Cervus canadensis TaxID=1574408 RepID=UPI001CA355C7|nr:MICOS complex subunit MIC25 isoform X9 [Cervus canadensis]